MRIVIVDCTIDGALEVLMILASHISETVEKLAIVSDCTLWLNVLDDCVSCCYDTVYTPVFRVILDGCDVVVSDDFYSHYWRFSMSDPKFVDVFDVVVAGRVKIHVRNSK